MTACEHVWERPSQYVWRCTFCKAERDTRRSTVAPDTGAAASGVMGPVVTPEEVLYVRGIARFTQGGNEAVLYLTRRATDDELVLIQRAAREILAAERDAVPTVTGDAG